MTKRLVAFGVIRKGKTVLVASKAFAKTGSGGRCARA